LRLAAHQKLGLAEIEAEVLDISPEKARILAMLENMAQPMFWLDRYIGIEDLLAGSPDMTQKQAAARLGLNQPYVSRAMKLLAVLNQGSRQKIYRQAILSTFLDVPERAVFALTDLATGQPDDQIRVEQALKVVLDRKMTEKQVKALVEWVKAGNTPESFQPSHPSPRPSQARGEGDMAGAGLGGAEEQKVCKEGVSGKVEQQQSADAGDSDSTGVLSLLKNAASASTPKSISGKILKWIAMWIADKFNSSKVEGQKDVRNEFEKSSNGVQKESEMPNSKSQIPNGFSGIPNSENPKLKNAKARSTVVIAVAVAAGVFVVGLGLMKLITPAVHPNNAHSVTAQKQDNIVPVADNNAGKSSDTTFGSVDQYAKSSEREQAIKYCNEKDYSSAFLWFSKAMEKYGPQAEIYWYMGFCEYNLGNIKEAVEYFEEYSKMNPDDEKIKAKIEELKSTVPPPDGMEAGK